MKSEETLNDAKESHYIWAASLYYIIILSFAFIAVMIVLLMILFRPQYHGFWAVFCRIFSLSTIAALFYAIWICRKGSMLTILQENGVSFQMIFDKRIFATFDEIMQVKTLSWDWSVVMIRTSNDFILLNTQVLNLGELIERILERAVNVKTVRLSKLPFTRYWGKYPDTKLIQNAMERADLNRKSTKREPA